MTQRYLDVAAAAIYLGITEIALRLRVKRRTIPFIKDGARVKFDVHELDKHMKSCRVITAREEKQKHGSAAA